MSSKYVARISRILDHDGTPKISPEARGRIGRTIDIDRSRINVGEDGFLYCIYPDSSKSLHTSKVRDVNKTNSEVVIWTRNSIYVLQRIEFL